jgi:hypothetical protein
MLTVVFCVKYLPNRAHTQRSVPRSVDNRKGVIVNAYILLSL